MTFPDTWTRRAAHALRALWCRNCGAVVNDPDLSAPCPKCGQ
jgi:Zn finger protein HypA/HybF involved in hydrogenase expression